jgi:hypothetical protein
MKQPETIYPDISDTLQAKAERRHDMARRNFGEARPGRVPASSAVTSLEAVPGPLRTLRSKPGHSGKRTISQSMWSAGVSRSNRANPRTFDIDLLGVEAGAQPNLDCHIIAGLLPYQWRTRANVPATSFR